MTFHRRRKGRERRNVFLDPILSRLEGSLKGLDRRLSSLGGLAQTFGLGRLGGCLAPGLELLGA